ncbi:MAG: tetratricopeptide repeat protein, partial [Alphaproteobacteria bacterium]
MTRFHQSIGLVPDDHDAMTVPATLAKLLRRGLLAAAIGLTWAMAIALMPEAARAANGLLQAREGVSALLRGDYEKAVAAYSRALEDRTLSDPRRANIYNDRGVAKWRLKDARGAVEDFNKAIELFPDYAVVYNNRGNALLELKQPEEAIKDFDRAIALAPAYGAAYNNRGNANHMLGHYEAAARDFRKAARLMPTNAVPYNGRGKTHVALGKPFAALRDFNRAITLNAKYSSAHENRAQALMAVDRYNEAVADYSSTIKTRPDDPMLYVLRGRAYAGVRKFNSAFRDFDKALKLAPDFALAYLERAKVQMMLKRYLPAQKDAAQAVALDPSLAEAFRLRGETYLRLGLAAEGLGDANVAVHLDPGDAEALALRGKIHELLERREEAIEDYRAALALRPDHAEARAGLEALGEEPPDVPAVVKVGDPAWGWQIYRDASGKYFARNGRFPKMRVDLEMYGEGEPRILAWNVLKNQLRGIALLEYYAGAAGEKEKKDLEYVAILDLWRSRVVSIEPDKWGDDSSRWTWKYTSVVVTDPEGNANEITLRKARLQAYGEEGESGWFTDGFGQPRQRRPQRKR